ncbi:MAG: ATP-binding protein [Verrucomicrobiota bacterium]
MSPPRPLVHISGVVTWRGVSGEDAVLSLEDASGGILLNLSLARAEQVWAGDSVDLESLAVGNEIDAEGLLDSSGPFRTILPVKIQVTGQKSLPTPTKSTQKKPKALLRPVPGRFQRTEMSGTIHYAKPKGNSIELRVEQRVGTYFLAEIPASNDFIPGQLEDAEITLRGVAMPLIDIGGKTLRTQLMVSSPTDLVITKPAPTNPFSIRKMGIGRFIRDREEVHRRRVEGVVTYWDPGSLLFLQQGSTAIRILTDSTETIQIGDTVEAVGFIETKGDIAELRRCLIRRIGPGIVPKPVAIQKVIPEAKDDGTTSTGQPNLTGIDGLLLEVRGTILRTEQIFEDGCLRILLDDGKLITSASMPLRKGEESPALFSKLRAGSVVSLVGVGLVDFITPHAEDESPGVGRLNLLLRDLSDITVLSVGPWWTPQTFAYALIGVGVLLAGALLWVAGLRRLVRKNVNRLELLMRSHRDSELEFNAVQQERQRLAADMHDGIQQLIAGAAFRLETAEDFLDGTHTPVQLQLNAAREALVSAQASLRNFLSGSVLSDDASGDFVPLIQHTLKNIEQWPASAISLQVQGDPFRLSRPVMGSLLLVMQEALGNAFKHGQASHVEIVLSYEEDAFEVTLTDNGIGFDVAKVQGRKSAHFGLDSMQQRTSWLGGVIEIKSAKKEGTCIKIVLPRDRAAHTRNLDAS